MNQYANEFHLVIEEMMKEEAIKEFRSLPKNTLTMFLMACLKSATTIAEISMEGEAHDKVIEQIKKDSIGMLEFMGLSLKELTEVQDNLTKDNLTNDESVPF